MVRIDVFRRRRALGSRRARLAAPANARRRFEPLRRPFRRDCDLGRASKAHIDAGTDGVDVAIRLNDETLLTEYIEGDDAKGILFYIRRRVEQGDVVRFVVSRHNNYACDTTRFDPKITYQDGAGESFSASAGFDARDADEGKVWTYEYLLDERPYERAYPENYAQDFGATIQYEWLREDKILPNDSGGYLPNAVIHLKLARALLEDLEETLDELIVSELDAALAKFESAQTFDFRPVDA